MALLSRIALCVPLLTSGVFTLAAEDGGDSALALLITAKFSGGCVMITQMATFQQSTKMPKGDEFLERFLSTETARLGMTPQEYVERCRRSDEIYQSYYDELKASPAP